MFKGQKYYTKSRECHGVGELVDGTPFTQSGATRSKRLGIQTIVLLLVTERVYRENQRIGKLEIAEEEKSQ